MHSSRMHTARSLIVSPYLVVSHACPPWEQPCMPPQSNHAPPLGATTHAPPEQPCMPPCLGAIMHTHTPPPRSKHTCHPPRATMHAPPTGATTHPPSGSNHARLPLEQPHMPPPRSNHARELQ